MTVTSDTVAAVRGDLEAIRNRGLAVAGYFTPGSPKWVAAMAVPGRANIALARLTPPPEPEQPAPTGTVVTPGNLFETLADAKAGDTLVFTAGVYEFPVLTGLSGVTFVDTGGVTVTGNHRHEALSLNGCQNLVFRGFTFRDGPAGYNQACIYGWGGSKNITFQDTRVGPTPCQGVFLDKTTAEFTFLRPGVSGCRKGDEPNRVHGLYLQGTAHRFEDPVVTDVEAFGIQVGPYSRDLRVLRPKVSDTGQAGVVLWSDVAGTLIASGVFTGRMVDAVRPYRLTGVGNVVRECVAEIGDQTAFVPGPGVEYLDCVAR